MRPDLRYDEGSLKSMEMQWFRSGQEDVVYD